MALLHEVRRQPGEEEALDQHEKKILHADGPAAARRDAPPQLAGFLRRRIGAAAGFDVRRFFARHERVMTRIVAEAPPPQQAEQHTDDAVDVKRTQKERIAAPTLTLGKPAAQGKDGARQVGGLADSEQTADNDERAEAA